MASVATPTARRHLERLERIWAARPGLVGWLTTVDHKRIGLLYFFTSLVFFAAGGVEAILDPDPAAPARTATFSPPRPTTRS